MSLPEVEGILYQMAAYLPQAGSAGLRYEAKVFDLLAALLEWNDLTLSAPTAASISAKDQEAMQSLKHFLLQNYSTKVDLQRLAQMCYMSKSKLTYLFRMLSVPRFMSLSWLAGLTEQKSYWPTVKKAQ